MLTGRCLSSSASAAASSSSSPSLLQVVTEGQEVTFEYQGINYLMKANSVLAVDAEAEQRSVHRGLLMAETAFVFETRHGGGIKVTGQRSVATNQLFKHKEVNFEKLGIGGLDAQFDQIFRRAFASRVFPPAVVERLGIRHVRGMLLFGPPGARRGWGWRGGGGEAGGSRGGDAPGS